ncbi:MAG: hypothetical protein QXM31_01890 [Candidatus Woesearchaeota archaeon]
MELKEVLASMEKSSEFKTWRKSHEKAFLAHAFVMMDEANKDTWQIGYFDAEKSLMSTFVVSTGKIDIIPDQEVFKSEHKIAELEPEKVKLTVKEALDIAEKYRKENYPKEITAKSFFIIQVVEAHGQVFNITYFTQSFKTINIKLSTENGKILHHSCEALVAFG